MCLIHIIYVCHVIFTYVSSKGLRIMNLRHLWVFHVVASTGSITGAAEKLFVSQPVVSRQVRELEARLGLTLLERMPRGVRLTEAGQILQQYADRMFSVQRQAQSVLESLRGLQFGRLKLGASTTIGNYLLPPVLAEFAHRFPEIDVSLEIANTEIIHNRLFEDQIDLGFTEGFPGDGDLVSEVLLRDELVIVAPAGYRFAGKAPVPLAHLCGQPFVMREVGSGTRAVFEEELRAHGDIKLSRVLSIGSPEAVKRAVIAGAGLAVVSYLAVSAELKAGILTRIPVSDMSLKRPLYRVELPYKQPSPALKAFIALLSEAIRSLGESNSSNATGTDCTD